MYTSELYRVFIYGEGPIFALWPRIKPDGFTQKSDGKVNLRIAADEKECCGSREKV